MATGTIISDSSTVIFNDGRISDISEHWFKVNSGDSEDMHDFGDGTEVTTVDSFGNVMSLNNAIHADETGILKELVDQFKNSNDYVEKRILVKRILYFITDSADVPIRAAVTLMQEIYTLLNSLWAILSEKVEHLQTHAAAMLKIYIQTLKICISICSIKKRAVEHLI